jgi:hypothetical protein
VVFLLLEGSSTCSPTEFKGMFVSTSQLFFSAESQKQEQTVKFLTAFWNAEKQVSAEMNQKLKSSFKSTFQVFGV